MKKAPTGLLQRRSLLDEIRSKPFQQELGHQGHLTSHHLEKCQVMFSPGAMAGREVGRWQGGPRRPADATGWGLPPLLGLGASNSPTNLGLRAGARRRDTRHVKTFLSYS